MSALPHSLFSETIFLCSKKSSAKGDRGSQRTEHETRAQAQELGLDVAMEAVEGVPQWERGDSDRCDLLLPNGSTESLRIVALTGSASGEVEGEVVIVNYFLDKNQSPPPQGFDEGNKKRIVFFPRELERDR